MTIIENFKNIKLYVDYMTDMSEDYIVEFGLGDGAILTTGPEPPGAQLQSLIRPTLVNALLLSKMARLLDGIQTLRNTLIWLTTSRRRSDKGSLTAQQALSRATARRPWRVHSTRA